MVIFGTADDVVAALEETELIPHPAHDESTGTTMRLRAAMARFSAPESHHGPRAAVEALLRQVDPPGIAELASGLTAHRLVDRSVDVVRTIAAEVPVVAMLRALGLDDGLLEDVDAVVAVIGRGETPTARSGESADRLLASASDAGHDPVAAASALYQTMDATAALILCRLHAVATDTQEVAAVPRTRRIARTEVAVAGARLEAGAEVAVDLATRPFGAGLHQCPGREIAECITDAVVTSIAEAGYGVDLASVELDTDHRPRRLSVVRQPSAG